MIRAHWTLPLLVASCSTIVTPHPCLEDTGAVSPAIRWYGARLEGIHGSGTSCHEPVVVKGAYQPCKGTGKTRQCVGLVPYAEQLRQVMLLWVQINYSSFGVTGFRGEDCGDYEAAVAFLVGTDGRAKRVYFDTRDFRAVRFVDTGAGQDTDTSLMELGGTDAGG